MQFLNYVCTTLYMTNRLKFKALFYFAYNL